MSTALKALGRPYSISFLGGHIVNGENVYAYLSDFKKTYKLREMMALNGSGKIAGLVFRLVK